MSTKLIIIYLPVDSIKPNLKNPRDHSGQQIRLLVQSIKNLGFNVPVVIDSAGNIIAGHARYLAAIKIEEAHEEYAATIFHLAD